MKVNFLLANLKENEDLLKEARVIIRDEKVSNKKDLYETAHRALQRFNGKF
jgi:hypothetical protein